MSIYEYIIMNQNKEVLLILSDNHKRLSRFNY